MDQSHSRIPYLGTQDNFEKALKQHITGVLNHATGQVTLYRNFDNISKGPNLTLYCVLREIEKWRDSHQGNYPEEIYLQFDGGCENANKYVLTMCELLVSKRMARLIYFTRLPVGHTHADIDACFGHIWRHMRGSSVKTIESYKFKIEDAFKGTKLNVKVTDVYVVPNYEKYFEGCIDSKFGNCHKELDTQHQWKFEAIPDSLYFPFG
jgi:hypothetical protein